VLEDEAASKLAGHLDAAVQDKILRGNAIRLFGLNRPAVG
jgi:hypothetical protein